MPVHSAPVSSPSTSLRVPLIAAVAIVIGNMIGTGVFGSLGFQAMALPAGFSILMLWLAGGILAFCGAVHYAELAAAFPRSGGEYQLLSRIYHPGIGFVSGWVSMIAGFPAPVALLALMLGTNVCRAAGGESLLVIRLLAAGIVVMVTGAHLISVAFSGRFQWLSTALKVLLILVLTVCGFVLSNGAGASLLPQPGETTLLSGKWDAIFQCLIYVLFAYSGWNAACYIAGEVENPQRNVPRALLIGTGIVTVLYMLVNAAMLHATPMNELAASGLDVSYVAALHIFGPAGAAIMAGLIAIGLVSAISAMTWAGPRVSQQMGRDYPMLSFLARTDDKGVPWLAVLLQSALALGIIFTMDPQAIINSTEFLLQIFLLLTVWGVVHLRMKQPDLPRPCRAWGYPYTTGLFLVMIAFTLAWMLRNRPDETRVGLGVLIVGIAGYFLAGPRRAEE